MCVLALINGVILSVDLRPGKKPKNTAIILYRLVGQRLNAPKLSEAVASYLEISKQQVKITTYQKLRLRMNKYILGMLPDIRIDQLNYLDLSKWWNGIKRLKIQDKNIFLNDLKRLFEHGAVYFNCRNEEVNKLIPYKDYSIKTRVRPLKYITYDDFKKFLKVSADDYFYLLYVLTFISGLRMGELRGLKVPSSGSIGDSIHLSCQASNKTGSGKIELISLKSKNSERDILLPDFLKAMLNQHIKAHKLKPGNFLFFSPWSKNAPIGETSINRDIIKRAQKAGLTYNIHLHMFRATEATNMKNAGIDIETVRKCLGHSDSGITKKYYIQQTPEEIKKIKDYFLSLIHI